MATIIIKRPTKPIGEADARVPAGNCAKSAVVGYKVTDIDALALRGKLPDLVFPSTMRGVEERFGRIIDVKQIPTLLAAPDLEGLPLDHPAQPDAQKSLSSILDTHSRPVNVGQSQRAALDPIDVGICF